MKMCVSAQGDNLSPTPSFKAFVFDLDGTLLDTLPDLVVLTNATLRECGFPERTPEEIRGFVGNGIKGLMYQAVPGDAGEVATEDAMSHWKSLYPRYGHCLTRPYPEVMETITHLLDRGVKLAVLSNKFDAGVQDAISTFFPNRFQVVHGEGGSIPRKPDPAGLLQTIQELGVLSDQVAYVGDSRNDMVVARRAGAYALGVSWGYQSEAVLHKAGANDIVHRAKDWLSYAQ